MRYRRFPVRVGTDDFSPKQIAAKEGPGQYEVKFYSGQEPVLRCSFWIR